MTDDSNPTEWLTTTEAPDLTGYTAQYPRRLINIGICPRQEVGS